MEKIKKIGQLPKEQFREMERDYCSWLERHPKGDMNYKAFSHMKRTLEFADYRERKATQHLKDQIKRLRDELKHSCQFTEKRYKHPYVNVIEQLTKIINK